MTAAADFQRAIRSGRRLGSGTLVVHYWCCNDGLQEPRVGLSVGKPVGNSVVRHRVARRLRHVLAMRLDGLPHGSLLVVRAKPSAATADSARLAADLDTALHTLRNRP